MKKYFSLSFWDYTGERAVKTAAQSLLGGLGVGTGILTLPWEDMVAVAASITLASILSSILFFKGDGSDIVEDFS